MYTIFTEFEAFVSAVLYKQNSLPEPEKPVLQASKITRGS